MELFGLAASYCSSVSLDSVVFCRIFPPVHAPIAGFLAGRSHLFASAAVTALARVMGRRHIFCLHVYLYIRTFAPTTLTEPLGVLLALASVPFFIEAFRTESLPAALLAFAFAVSR